MRELRSWKWEAADLTGKIHRGIRDDTDAAGVHKDLRQRRLYPLRIRPRLNLFDLWAVRLADVRWIHFARSLALLLDAGLPLLQALDILAHRPPNRYVHSAQQLQMVKQKIEEGYEFHEAVTVLRPIPNSFIRYCLRAAEQNGTLVRGLEEIASSLETERQFKKKIRAALSYPLILLVMTAVILMSLSFWLLPMYESLFSYFNVQLPTITRLVFGVGKRFPQILILFFIGVWGLWIMQVFIPKIKISIARGLRGLPLWGTIIRLRDEEHFARTLAQLLSAGLPVLDALKLMQDFEYNVGVSELVEDLFFAANEGRRLAPVLKMSEVMTEDKAELFHIGEESGKLEESLMLISRWAQLELEEKLAELARFLEPFLIVIMAGLIGLIAIGVLLPVMQTSAYIH